MCAIINVLEGFLRGYIGAMLVLRSDGCELAIFSNSRKVDFCDTSIEISMILKWAMKNIENPELSNVQKRFCCMFSHERIFNNEHENALNNEDKTVFNSQSAL